MTFLLLVLVVSTAGAMIALRTGGARWCMVGGTGVGLLAGIVHATRPTLFLAENGFWFAFLVFGVPSVLVGLCAGFMTRTLSRHILE
jgi:hypothetical protein